jgi:abortive infection bacteriophage resistance protein
MDALERVEIAIRTNITYHLAHQYGAFALNSAQNFHDKFDHASWITQVQQEISRSREPFIEHFKEKLISA